MNTKISDLNKLLSTPPEAILFDREEVAHPNMPNYSKAVSIAQEIIHDSEFIVSKKIKGKDWEKLSVFQPEGGDRLFNVNSKYTLTEIATVFDSALGELSDAGVDADQIAKFNRFKDDIAFLNLSSRKYLENREFAMYRHGAFFVCSAMLGIPASLLSWDVNILWAYPLMGTLASIGYNYIEQLCLGFDATRANYSLNKIQEAVKNTLQTPIVNQAVA